jgi:mono/diheme cytochrome c family protein
MRRKRLALAVAIFSAVAALWSGTNRSATAADVDFDRDIKPVLSRNCFQCHGFDPEKRKGGTHGLRLDNAAGATEDLGSGTAAIVPGHPEKSELVERITSQDPDEQMPLKASGKKLTPREIELLTEWIKQGAKYSQHWSYVKPVRAPLPPIADKAWPKNPIDYFILARLEKEGLKPSPEADRDTLIRRVSIDVTGLPPSPAEVDEFVADKSPDAYQRLVDRLLAKPAYGERWAQVWLDLARYADSAGYANDPERKIWLYRDYVIRSFNANKPFDQFTIEQLAGDLLPNPTDDQLIATAFHRNTMTNTEGGTNPEEFRNVAIIDRVNTTMAVWMGTTINCAQCHTHKFDPITNEEYFRFFAFFNNTEDANRGDESPLLSVYTEEQKQQRARDEEKIAELRQSLERSNPELAAAQAKWERAFPADLKWSRLMPASAKAQSGVAGMVADDGAVKIPAGAKSGTITVEVPLAGTAIRALRLEVLPDEATSGKATGRAETSTKNAFVLTRVTATLNPPSGTAVKGRFVRIELPGKSKFLSLAEVQAFRGSENVALRGEAKQSSTDFGGDARRAIDGNTNGQFEAAKSTSHTALSDNPWWEVDLKSEQSLDRIVVWNRTDGGLGSRLANFRVQVLNDKHQPVWQKVVAAPPLPSVELSLSGRREIEFTTAVADDSQAGSDAQWVLKNPDPQTKGWSVGEPSGKAHSLTLLASSPISAPAGSTLTFTLEQNPRLAGRTLDHFALSATEDNRAAEWLRIPAPVLAALRIPGSARSAAQRDAIAQYYRGIAPEQEATRNRLRDLTKQLSEIKPETVPIMRELPPGQRRITKMQQRGNYLVLGKEVQPGIPAAFPPLPKGAPMNRLTLARWLVGDNNPLTPRVIANRYWEQIFGIGIVATSEDFGSQGDRPVHPELLDWLATELLRSKWDTKALVRLLVTSAAYRQSSRITPEFEARDPENRLLARGPRFRLSAEELRDQALVLSGLFSPKMYGPPTHPPQPSSGLSAAFGGGIDWQTSLGEDKYRRGLYTTWRRSNLYPSMATFDAPSREVCSLHRVRTNTPLQALVTLNDPVFVETAQGLARRIVAAGGTTPDERVSFGIRLCLARSPHDGEVSRMVKLYDQALARYRKDATAATRMATNPLGPAPKGNNVAELAAWTVVSNVLLNLDETLMKR